MRDLFDAAEQLSALLAMRVEYATRKRGWPTKVTSRPISPTRGRLVHLVSISVLLPRGEAGNFVPRPEPTSSVWTIDVKRSDGILRKTWSSGIQIGQPKGGSYVLLYEDDLLRDEKIDQIIEDLSRPGPSGVALWIRKVWGIRFGRMPVELSDRIEAVEDPDLLDQVHACVLRATDRQNAEELIAKLIS